MPDRAAKDAALLLDRYWDEVLSGHLAPAESNLDPILAATVRRVHALDATPPPPARFASTLWEDLVHKHADAIPMPGSILPSSPLLLEPVMAVPRHRFGGRDSAPLSRLAAAILLFALIAAAAIAALYPLGLLDRNMRTILAPLDNSPAEQAIRAGDELLSLTLPDLPPLRTFGGLTLTDYPPAASSQERTRRGPQVWYVAIGPITLSVTEAVEPVRVISPGSTEPTNEDTLLDAGDRTELAAGSTVVSAAGSVIEVLNTGSEPARLLALIAADASDSDGTLRGGAVGRWGSVGMPQQLIPPVRIELRQVTVNPSAALPIPPTDMGDYAAAVLDSQRVRDLSFAADLGWRNTSFAPLEAYVLKITSLAPAPD